MAKYGEGDKRWIVEERPDGTNVHNWHWVETNCLEWSRKLLSELLQDLPIISGESNIFIRTKTLENLDGEAYVNVRKGKIIPGYELSLTLSWEGEARNADGSTLLKVDGNVEIPYIADENADEDPEVKVTVKDDGPIGRTLKDAFLAKGKGVVLEKIRIYVDRMAKGGPAKEDLEVKKPKSQAANAGADAATPSAEPKNEVKKKEEGKKGFKTITMTERFHCRAKDVYEILMDENRWKGFTQSNAKISKEVGGQFTLFDGAITGVNVELEEGKRIVQKWRFGNWEDGIHSTVELTFDEPEAGITIIRFTQTDVPEVDRYGIATVVENTKELIFDKIGAAFGFGFLNRECNGCSGNSFHTKLPLVENRENGVGGAQGAWESNGERENDMIG